WFVAWNVVWAFSVWYWSRVILDAGAGDRPSKLYHDWSILLPRVAGFLTLFGPGGACLLAAFDATASRGRLIVLGTACIVLSLLFGVYVILRRRIRGLSGPAASGYSIASMAKPSVVVFVLSSILSL